MAVGVAGAAGELMGNPACGEMQPVGDEQDMEGRGVARPYFCT